MLYEIFLYLTDKPNTVNSCLNEHDNLTKASANDHGHLTEKRSFFEFVKDHGHLTEASFKRPWSFS